LRTSSTEELRTLAKAKFKKKQLHLHESAKAMADYRAAEVAEREKRRD
jgi:hypothetical protein